MNKEHITIGQFCKDTGVTPSKLRYYESLGLIKPAEIDEHNGYHYYSCQQYAEIEVIQLYRKLNFPIKKIQNIIEKNDRDFLFELISKQRFQARKLLLQQQEILNNLSWLYDTWEKDRMLHKQIKPILKLKRFPKRQVLMTKLSAKSKLLPIKEQNALLQRSLCKKAASELSAVNSVQRIYGFSLDRNSFLEGSLCLSGKYVSLPKYIMNIETKLRTLSAGTYLTFYVQAFADKNWIQSVLSYAKKNNYSIQKIYINEVALHFVPHEDNFFEVEILVIPISFS